MREVVAKLAAMSGTERTAFLAGTRPAPPAEAADGPAVRARPDGRSPASPVQEQHWFLDRLWSGDAAYLVPFALRLRGPLDIGALSAALRTVVRRHEVLRSRFAYQDGVVHQVVSDLLPAELTAHRIPGDTPSARERAAADYGRRFARERFDLENGPLLRTRLLELGPQDHVLLWVAHHAVADGWSVGVLIEELGSAYRTQLRDGAAEPPSPALQFADVACWLRERLTDDRLAELVERRRAHLGTAPAAALPTDLPRPAVQTFRGESLDFVVPAATAAGVTALARRHGTTLYSVLLTALHVLLARHTGEPDAVIGAVTTGRTRPEAESLIGPFATTVPLRIDASDDPTFLRLLTRVQGVVADGLADQELPFAHLVKELGAGRDTSRNPLYQTLFSMGSLPLGAGETQLAPGLTVRPVGLPNGTSRLDLELTMESSDGALAGRLDINTDLFRHETALTVIERFQVLLEAVAADPDLPVSHYPLTAGPERRRALETASRPDRPAIETGFLELFAAQVARRPDATAVRCGTEQLSYRELDALADRVAHAVRERATTSAPVVAVGTGRTVELLPAVVGVLKAGGVYLPLELEYPADRLAYMLRDSRAELLLTGSRSPLPEPAGLFPAGATVSMADLPPDAAPVAAFPERDRLVYVMYTSGSTGRPKGIAVPHGALGNFLASMGDLGVMQAGDVTLALASLPFDGSVIELFLPLAVGAAVVVGQRADARDAGRLSRLLADHHVTVQHGTPSTWRLLLDHGQPLHLQRALSGGEALPTGLARELRSHVPTVWNLYGPAETTVYSLARRLDTDETPLIGTPVAGTTVHVLDELLRPVPTGVLGELCIGGAGVARGYLGLPELTAARFTVHPVTGERLYRTGDLFRRRPDGSLTFHGRADHQVKLRGHRIEPGEVEAVLARHPAVREAVVVPKSFAEDDRRLVAYVRTGSEVTEAELKAAARDALPLYMLPSRIVTLRDLPLNGSGKVDRRALEELPLTAAEGASGDTRPRTATEERLSVLWRQVLRAGDGPVAVDEDFFSAGGHSLLAVGLLHRVRLEAGVDVPLGVFFADPTVRGLAARVDAEPPSAELADLAREVADMSDEQVSAALAELAGEE